MKRIVCFFAILIFLAGLCGCRSGGDHTADFFYLRRMDAYVYGSFDAVICAEERSFSSQVSDLDYLLRIYLEGPVSENLTNPFPGGTRLLSTYWEGKQLTIHLSSEFSALTGIHMTLAGSCLSATCFALSDAENIQILSNGETYIYTRDSFLFLDDSAVPGA